MYLLTGWSCWHIVIMFCTWLFHSPEEESLFSSHIRLTHKHRGHQMYATISDTIYGCLFHYLNAEMIFVTVSIETQNICDWSSCHPCPNMFSVHVFNYFEVRFQSRYFPFVILSLNLNLLTLLCTFIYATEHDRQHEQIAFLPLKTQNISLRLCLYWNLKFSEDQRMVH